MRMEPGPQRYSVRWSRVLLEYWLGAKAGLATFLALVVQVVLGDVLGLMGG